MIANRDIHDVLHSDSWGNFRSDRCYAAIPEQPWKWRGDGHYKQCSNYGRKRGYCRMHQDIIRNDSVRRRVWWRRLLGI